MSTTAEIPRPPSAAEALARLREGNRRFAADLRSIAAFVDTTKRRAQVAGAQCPAAIVLGCCDSRAPAELVFDQGLGDLYVIRVAGNVVYPSQVGSVEFGADRFGTRLVVVMGHTHCGAIDATIEAVSKGVPPASGNLLSIVDRIRPAVEPLMRTELRRDPVALRREAVRANVLAATEHLRHGSAMIERMEAEAGLVIVGAVYDLESGVVEFLHEPPAAAR